MIKMKLIFLVYGQQISRIDKNILVSGSENYVYGQIVLGDYIVGVDEINKISAVLWKNNSTEYLNVNLESGTFQIPDDYINPGEFKISFQIEMGDRLITTDRIVMNVKSAGYDKIVELDPYQRLLKQFEKVENTLNQMESRISMLEKGDNQNDNDGTSNTIG